MIDAELENLSMRRMIRAFYTLTLRTSTEPKRLENLMEDLRALLAHHSEIHPDFQVRVERISDIGIEITLNYYVLTTEMNRFQEVREKFMLETLMAASKNEVTFATRPFID